MSLQTSNKKNVKNKWNYLDDWESTPTYNHQTKTKQWHSLAVKCCHLTTRKVTGSPLAFLCGVCMLPLLYVGFTQVLQFPPTEQKYTCLVTWYLHVLRCKRETDLLCVLSNYACFSVFQSFLAKKQQGQKAATPTIKVHVKYSPLFTFRKVLHFKNIYFPHQSMKCIFVNIS